MSKFREDPFVIFTLESGIKKHGLNHLRVRKHGDLIVFESGPKADPVRHIRLRRATRQWYTLEIATHTGQWQLVPMIRPARVMSSKACFVNVRGCSPPSPDHVHLPAHPHFDAEGFAGQ